MADDPGKRKRLDRDLRYTEEELRRLADEKRSRDERKLTIEEDIRTKSKIQSRPLLEDKRKRLQEEAHGVDEAGMREEAKGAAQTDDRGGLHAGKTGVHTETEAKGGGLADTSAHDSDSSHDAAHDAGPGEASDDGGDGGGDGDATGRRRRIPEPGPLYATNVPDMVKEAIVRHYDERLRQRGIRKGFTSDIVGRRRYLADIIDPLREERTLQDLKTIEERTPERTKRIRELNLLKAKGTIAGGENQELRRLEDEEAVRYWLRESVVMKRTIKEQRELGWMQPLGEGAFGVMPYTVLNTWDVMTAGARRSARWFADNQILRRQSAVVGQFIPKTPSLTWFQEKAKHKMESLFEDWDEEIYSDKKWREMVMKGQAQLEKIEEELSGYDQFTVEEERQIQRMFTDFIKKQMALAKEPEMYS
jgi:hypothetical protein